MKLWAVTLPAGLALICGAGLLMLKAQDDKAAQENAPLGNIKFDTNQPKHPVTPDMEKETALSTLKPAPRFEVADGRDVTHTIGFSAKPQFLLFIVKGCPCSVDAQPIMSKLSKHFGDAVEFYGITNGDKAEARDFGVRYSVPFPVIPDHEKAIIKGYQAKHSVYSALVAHGKIIKMWPGYSVDMLAEINETIAKTAGVPVKPFDPEYAPKEKTSGCAF